MAMVNKTSVSLFRNSQLISVLCIQPDLVTKQYSILPRISYRNQSTQSDESYFNDSLNVSLVIQKKRTVIHNLFSFSDNSLSYKSRNLIAVHVIGRVDVSINNYKFFGSFLNCFWASTLIFKEVCCFLLCMVFFICTH